MVTRYYICDNCGNKFILQQKLHDPIKKKCQICGKYELYQDLTGQHTFVYGEPTNLGHLAERNTQKMGKYELEAKRGPAKTKPTTWYNTEGSDLKKELSNLDTAEKKHNYIMKGE